MVDEDGGLVNAADGSAVSWTAEDGWREGTVE
jgi:hypothetical protein